PGGAWLTFDRRIDFHLFRADDAGAFEGTPRRRTGPGDWPVRAVAAFRDGVAIAEWHDDGLILAIHDESGTRLEVPLSLKALRVEYAAARGGPQVRGTSLLTSIDGNHVLLSYATPKGLY